MNRILLLLLFVISAIITNAQVKGTVIDSATKKAIERQVVGLVVKANPADTIYSFTDDNGHFRFDNVPATNFSILFNNMGFRPVAKLITVTKQEKTIDIGNVIMVPEGKLLEGVTVQVAAITVKEDTIEYNAGSFKVKENAVVEDLLKKLPGVTVDKDGNVTAQGKSVTRVKVNGKDFFGGDVKTATKELPANIVDKIQVIDDYGDQATVSGIKDGDPDKVINIQIKKDKNKGFFGRVTVGAGTEGRYQASFNGNFFNNNRQISVLANSNNTNTSLFNFSGGGNRGSTSMMRSGMAAVSDMGGMGAMNNMTRDGGGVQLGGGNNNTGISTTTSTGFNYRDQWGKRVSVYGSYSYSNINNRQAQTTSSQNFYESNSFINNQDLNAKKTSNSHRFTFNVEYQVDSFNYLKISPSVNYTGTRGNSFTLFDYAEIGGGKTSEGSTRNINTSEAPNVSANILFNHRFRKRGRNFSANVNLGTSQSNSTQDVTNLNYRYTGPFPGAFNTFQYIDQDNNNYNYGVRVTYSEPLSKTRSLDFSYSHNLNYGRNNKKTFNVDSLTKVRTINNFLSNDYENEFYNNRAGISLRTTKKKYNYTVGVSVQPVNLQGKSLTRDSAYNPIKRASIFPIARFVYNFTRTKSLNFSYTGNPTQPTFQQLQPVQDFSNPQYVTQGNPFLKPSSNHNLNFSFNNFNIVSGRILFTNLTLSTIKNQIVNNTINLDSTGSRQLSIPENVNGYYNVLGFYAFSKPYKNRKYVITLNGSANYNHNINLIDSNRSIGSNWILNQGVVFEFNYKDWLELGAGVSYGLNDVHYKRSSGSKTGIGTLQNSTSSNWTFSHNINVNFTKTLSLKYDLDYTINSGLASAVSRNQVIMNASLEQTLFKKKNGFIKLSAFDLFKQNSNISRSVTQNQIIDTRNNRLTRYFLLSFTYRLQRFAGQTVQQRSGMPGMMPGAPRF